MLRGPIESLIWTGLKSSGRPNHLESSDRGGTRGLLPGASKMPNECYFTGKKTTFGRKRAWSGQKITLGGFGLKATGISRRTFKPNIQNVNAMVPVLDADGNEVKGENGEVVRRQKKIKACTRAIRSGLVVKPLKRKYGYTRLQKADQDS
jgi:large subunit ribosomal protein L28